MNSNSLGPSSAAPIFAIVGPTASGKTRRAVELARALGGEIVSADSRQVYRGMDIGTGKDLEEYGDVPVHMLDVANAGEPYNLHRYLTEASACLAQIASRGHRAVVCGGSGLYVESLLKGIVLPEVPENTALRASLAGKPIGELAEILASLTSLHNVTDLDSCRRAIRAIEIHTFLRDHPETDAMTRPSSPLKAIIIGVDIDREARRRRIEERLRSRLEGGMIEEVEGLLKSGIEAETLIGYGLEYRWITLYLIGKISRDEMFDGLLTAIHQFAKRQMTWFRGTERRGLHIHWLPYDLAPEAFTQACLRLAEG